MLNTLSRNQDRPPSFLGGHGEDRAHPGKWKHRTLKLRIQLYFSPTNGFVKGKMSNTVMNVLPASLDDMEETGHFLAS